MSDNSGFFFQNHFQYTYSDTWYTGTDEYTVVQQLQGDKLKHQQIYNFG